MSITHGILIWGFFKESDTKNWQLLIWQQGDLTVFTQNKDQNPIKLDLLAELFIIDRMVGDDYCHIII